jgi:hypothetical protein
MAFDQIHRNRPPVWVTLMHGQRQAGAEGRSGCTLAVPDRTRHVPQRFNGAVSKLASISFHSSLFWPPQPQRSPEPGSSPPKRAARGIRCVRCSGRKLRSGFSVSSLGSFGLPGSTVLQRIDRHHNNSTIKFWEFAQRHKARLAIENDPARPIRRGEAVAVHCLARVAPARFQ